MTDPPFGVDNLSKQAVTQHGKKYARKIANDESPEQAIGVFQDVMNILLPKTRDNCDVYVFTSYQVLSEWLVMADNFFPDFGFVRKALIIWEKDGPGMGDIDVPYGMGMEFIMFFRKGKLDKRVPRRSAVLKYPQVHPAKLIHPHEKPLPLLEHLVRASTDKHDFVVDPFGGSCSLARACRNVDRSSVCIEYDEMNHKLAKESFEGGEGSGFDFS